MSIMSVTLNIGCIGCNFICNYFQEVANEYHTTADFPSSRHTTWFSQPTFVWESSFRHRVRKAAGGEQSHGPDKKATKDKREEGDLLVLFYFFSHEVLGRKKPHPLEIYIWKPILFHLGRLHFAWVPWISGSLTLTLMFWVFTQEQGTSFQSRNVDFMQCLSLDQILFCEIYSTCYIEFTFNSK